MIYATICVFEVHTMEELKLTGNHLKCSCPILTFSSNFDQNPHWKLFKEMITQIFGTPKGHRKSKPYHDHIFVFSIADDHIWFRNYQILCPHSGAKKLDRGDLEKMTLVEVGPRFCLNPIKVFGGSFGGPTQYENPFYVSPNLIRSLEKRQKAENLPRRSKPRQGGRCTSWQIPWKLMSLQISGRSDNLFSHIWFTIFAEVQLQQHPKWQKTSAVNLIVAANLGEFLLS